MRIYDLAYLAVRVLAIWLFINGLDQLVTLLNVSLPMYAQTFELEEMYAELMLIGVAPMLVFFAGSGLLWVMAKRLAGALIPATVNVGSGDGQSNDAQLRDMEGYVLSVIGLILLVFSFTGLVRHGVMSIYYSDGEIALVNMNLATSIELGIRCLIGILLLVKAEGFAIVLRKIRGLGRGK